MEARFAEEPIYVDYAQFGELRTFGSTNEAAMDREPLAGSLCWLDWAAIPGIPPPRAPWPGGPPSGPVVGISDVPLAQVTGQPRRFSYQFAPGSVPPYDRFALMVPASYSGGAYTPLLRDALGAEVPYDPAVWIADPLLMVIEFLYRTPSELGYTPPFTIDYWRYVGNTPENGISSVIGVGTGTGHVYSGTTGGVASFRALLADVTDAGSGIEIQDIGDDILISNTLTGSNKGSVGPNTGQVFDDKVAGLLGFRSIIAGAGVSVSQIGDDIVIGSSGGGGGISGLVNMGPGTQIFAGLAGTTAILRTLLSDASGGLAITLAGTPSIDERIVLANTMDGNSLGGTSIFAGRLGDQLNFYGLAADSGIALVQSATEILVSNNLDGFNLPGGVPLFAGRTGALLNFRSAVAGVNGVTITSDANTITIDSNIEGANLPGGAAIYAGKSGALLNFRSLSVAPSSGLQLTVGATAISIGAQTGEVITAATSSGGAIAILNSIIGNTLSLKGLSALSGVSLGVSAGAIMIGNTLDGQNTNPSGAFYKMRSGDHLVFKNLAVGSGLVVSDGADTVTITLANTPISSIVNEGGAYEIYDPLNSTATSATLRTLVAGTGGISITQEAKTLTINNSFTGQNINTGVANFQIYKTTTAGVMYFRTLLAGSGITLAQDSNDNISISLTSGTPITSIQNEGGGPGEIYDYTVGSTALLRTLDAGPLGGVTVVPGSGIDAGKIFIDNTMNIGTLGTGAALFSTRSGNVLYLKTISAGSNITLAATTNNVTISAAAGLSALANEGIGEGPIYDAAASSISSATLRTIKQGSGGIAVSLGTGGNTGTVVIDNTIVGATGTGTALYTGKVGSVLNFRSISPGANISFGSVPATATDVPISVTGVITSVQNDPAGSGQGVWASTAAGVATLKTILGIATNGITVTSTASTITIDNNLSGANITGIGTPIYAGKIAALSGQLQFNSIATDAASGLAISGPSGGLITLTNSMVGSTQGVGIPIYMSKNTSGQLLFRSISAQANSGLTVFLSGTPSGDIVLQPSTGVFLNAISNVGTGTAGAVGVWDSTSVTTAQLRSLVPGSGGVSVALSGQNIVIDNTLTGTSLGAATSSAIYTGKTGTSLNFRSILPGANISLTTTTTDITIAASIGVASVANEGTGTFLVDTASASAPAIRSLVAGAGMDVAVGVGAATATVVITSLVNVANISTSGATSSSLVSTTAAPTYGIKGLIAGSNVTITASGNDLTIAASGGGGLTSIANDTSGGGIGVWASTTSGIATMRAINGNAQNGTAVSLLGNTIVIDNTLTGANIGLGSGAKVFSDKSTAAQLRFRSLSSANNSGLTITQIGDDITFNPTSGTFTNNYGSVGVGAVLFDSMSVNTAQFRSIAGTPNNGVTVTGGTTIVIDNNLSGASIGGGTALYAGKISATFGQLQFNSLGVDTSSGLTISGPSSGLITLTNSLTGSSQGSGVPVFMSKNTSGQLLLRSISAQPNSGLTVFLSSSSSGDIVLQPTTGIFVNAVSNVGTGTVNSVGVYDSLLTTTAQLRSLVASANGIAVTLSGQNVLIDNTLTGATMTATGTGIANIYASKSAGSGANAVATLNFRALISAAGSGLDLVQNANDVTISASANTVVTAGNIGTGTGLYSATTGNQAQFKTLVPGTGGVTISATANTVVMDNTIVGNNVGTGSTLYVGKSAGVSPNVNLDFKSIVGGSNISVANNISDLTLLANISSWKAADVKTNGTAGGSSVAGVNIRAIGTFTTVGTDTTNCTQINSTTIQLQPGRYLLIGSAPAINSNSHVAYIRTTGSVVLLRGSTEYCATAMVQTRSIINGVINITGSAAQIQVAHYIQSSVATTGLGRAVSQGAAFTEVYTDLTIIMLKPTA